VQRPLVTLRPTARIHPRNKQDKTLQRTFTVSSTETEIDSARAASSLYIYAVDVVMFGVIVAESCCVIPEM
jgi:hypothetical protein